MEETKTNIEMTNTTIRYDIIRNKYPLSFERLTRYLWGGRDDMKDWYNVHEPTDEELRDFFNRNGLDFYTQRIEHFFEALENRIS